MALCLLIHPRFIPSPANFLPADGRSEGITKAIHRNFSYNRYRGSHIFLCKFIADFGAEWDRELVCRLDMEPIVDNFNMCPMHFFAKD